MFRINSHNTQRLLPPYNIKRLVLVTGKHLVYLELVNEFLNTIYIRLYFRFIGLQGVMKHTSRSQRPRGLRRRCSAARLLRLWVRIPPGARMSVCGECCVLSDRVLCDGLITRPEESYRLWRVVVCDQET